MAVGGSIEEITIDGRIFSVAADSDPSRDLGGFAGDFQSNGDGTGRRILVRKAWQISGLTISIDDEKGDHEYLQEKMNQPDNFPISITYVSGVTYQGSGNLTGDLNLAAQATTTEINLMGPQVLTKQ